MESVSTLVVKAKRRPEAGVGVRWARTS